MNISDVIKDIKLPNGLKTIALPYKEPIENVIQDIIKTSVRTFSQFKPQEKECERYRKDLRYATDYDRYRGIYFIPEELTTTEVSYCDAEPIATTNGKNDQVSMNVFSAVSPFVGFGAYGPQDIMNATVTGAAVNKFTGVTSKVPTSAFDWEYERNGQYVEEIFETGTYTYTAPDGVLYMRSGSYLFNISGNTMKVFDIDDVPVITLKRQ